MHAQKPRRYKGAEITVLYDVARCIHAAECVKGLPSVFDAKRRPWVQPDNSEPGLVAHTVEKCPSGALYYEPVSGADEAAAPGPAVVRAAANGPLYVRGNVVLKQPDGAIIAQLRRVALCRCGASANKPFCDGSHAEAGFSDSGSLGDRGVVADPALVADRLEITPVANGSLRVRGDVTVSDGTGETTRSGSKTSLCRCGHSNNKPFCDGTHRSIEFNTEP